MTNETEEMRKARHELQILSGSDPVASANMMRYVAALGILLTGRRSRDRRPMEPQVVAGFRFTHGEETLCAEATRRSGTDCIYLAFDIDDAAGPPVAVGVFSPAGDQTTLYGACRLWSPANDGRAVLVPAGADDYIGYLSFRAGHPLRLVDAPLPGDLKSGQLRADARLRRLLASDALRDAHRGGYMNVIRNDGPDLFAISSRIAA